MQETDIYHYPIPYITFHGTPNTVFEKTDHMNPDGIRGKIKLNEMGFRIERPLQPQKQPGEKRIFVLGSSTIFNGFPLENSIPGQVEACFHRDGRSDVQVFNFGFVSSVSGQELSLLVHLLSDYEPDAVIIYNGGNDICLPTNFDPRPGYPYNFLAYEAAMRRIRLEPRQGYNEWVLHGERLDYDLGALRSSCGYGSKEWETNITVKYIKNMIKMGHFARGFGFKLFVFLEPILFLKAPLVGKEKEIPPPYGKENFHYYVERQYHRIRKIFEYIGKVEDKEKVVFTDLSLIFNNYCQEVFWDYRHVNNEGNRYIAENIYTFLQGTF
jgi:hypothetical protein